MNKFSYPKEPNKMMISSSSNSNTEEFSFPVMSNPLSSFMLSSSSASSSSLWRISSRVYHHQEDFFYDNEEENDGDYDHMEVRSMCEEIMPSRREVERSFSFQSKELEVEESMDYLWEDFNEESVKENKDDRSEEMGVIQGTKMGRRSSNSSSSSTKMLVIGKLLKGLVSIRKSAQSKLMKPKF